MRKTKADIMLEDGMKFFWRDKHGHECKLEIIQDQDADSPRTDTYHPSTMACWHKRYKLGDNIDAQTISDFLIMYIRENIPKDKIMCALDMRPDIRIEYDRLSKMRSRQGFDTNPLDTIASHINGGDLVYAVDIINEFAEVVPIYGYEHGGLTISASDWINPYHDKHDSGFIGVIIITRDDALENLNCNEDNWREVAHDSLVNEIKEYDMYLQGDVWLYNLYHQDAKGDWDLVDTCCGFLGSGLESSGMSQYVDDLTDAINNDRCRVVGHYTSIEPVDTPPTHEYDGAFDDLMDTLEAEGFFDNYIKKSDIGIEY